MTETPNPYQSPAAVDAIEGWWSRFWKRLRPVPARREPQFEKGEALLCYGVAYLIELNDPSTLHAALPSSEATQERMERLVAEAVRVLPLFLATHPKVHPLLRGRRLCVRMIEIYTDLSMERMPRVTLDSDVVEAACHQPHESIPADLMP
jgi:hypothetical protein